MGRTLRIYLLKQFINSIFLAVISLAMLFLVFDILAHSDDILAGGMSPWEAVPLYALLRLPQLVSLVMPIAGMLAIMAIYTKLHGQQEITAITSSGVRLFRVVLVFIVGALFVAILHFIFLNSLVLKTSEKLRMWQENDYKPTSQQVAVTRYPTWFQIQDKLIYVQEASANNTVLNDLKIIERDNSGIMKKYLIAGQATHVKGTKWQLTDVEIRQLDTGETEKTDDRMMDLKSKPQALVVFNKSTGEMTLGEMINLIKASHLTNNRGYYYETWFLRRFSQPLSTVIMMLIATPLLFLRPRQQNKTGIVFTVVIIGFLYFIGERILLAMSENGDIQTFLATYAPPVTFTGLLLLYILWKEPPYHGFIKNRPLIEN